MSLRPREYKGLARGHTACLQQSSDWNPCLLTPNPVLFAAFQNHFLKKGLTSILLQKNKDLR